MLEIEVDYYQVDTASQLLTRQWQFHLVTAPTDPLKHCYPAVLSRRAGV